MSTAKKARLELVPCSKIIVAERHRKDMGDLQELADSILKVGQLQPIGVTPDFRLVLGERRLRAVRDILHEQTIKAVIIEPDTFTELDCERDENEVRKPFTPSERVAIAEALRAQIGERRGKPATDSEDDIPENIPELAKGKDTREVVADLAGFGNYKTMEQAEKVVKSGCDDLVAAMDAGQISVSKAAKIAALPAKEQKAVVKNGGKMPSAPKPAKAKAKPSENKPDDDEDGPREFSMPDFLVRLSMSVRLLLKEVPECSRDVRDVVADELHAIADAFAEGE